jgi:hypothetical protein
MEEDEKSSKTFWQQVMRASAQMIACVMARLAIGEDCLTELANTAE